MKSQKRLVAFEDKSIGSLSKDNKNTKIDEFTVVKNFKIFDNASTPYNNKSKNKQFENTLVESKYLKTKIKNGGLKGFVKNYLKNLPHI